MTARHHPPCRPAFTLVELLVTIGIIALLISLLAVALKGVRRGANRTVSLGSVRQLMLAHISYTTDYQGTLLPGFLDQQTLADLNIKASLEDGTKLTACSGGVCDASSFVWRLAPYYGYDWKVLMTDYRSKQLQAALDRAYNQDQAYGHGSVDIGAGELAIGIVPSFGLNSIFVGGDTVHGGQYAVDRNPWSPAVGLEDEVLAATQLAQAKNPAMLIVFGATKHTDPGAFGSPPVTNLEFGSVELRAPFLQQTAQGMWAQRQWYAAGGVAQVDPAASFGAGGGIPIARWGENLMPSATLDGATHLEDISELTLGPAPSAQDPDVIADAAVMSRWSPFAFSIGGD